MVAPSSQTGLLGPLHPLQRSQNDGRVVSNVVVQALRGKPITIYGDGRLAPAVCYVDDLIEGFVRLMASPADVTGPIDLGNPGEFTLREMAEMTIDSIGSKSALTFLTLPQDGPKQRRPHNMLAEKLLDWRPRVALADGSRQPITFAPAAQEQKLKGRQFGTLVSSGALREL